MSLIDIEEFLPEGWDIGGFDDTFICPCGDEIEQDGVCPQGCVSPLIEMGWM